MNNNIHSFPRQIAKDHTITAAILFQFIATKVQRSRNIKNGKKWFYDSGAKIQKRYDYIKTSTIHENAKRLKGAGLLEIDNFNKWPPNRTLWYHVPNEHLPAAGLARIRFDKTNVEKYGIPGAVLLFNLRHFLKMRLKKTNDLTVTHKMLPKLLATLLPLSEATIKSALAKMVAGGAVLKPDRNKPEYRLPEVDMRELRRDAMLKK
jgi:hypothetical protein